MHKKWNAIARYFLGIVFLVAGINGYVYLFGSSLWQDGAGSHTFNLIIYYAESH